MTADQPESGSHRGAWIAVWATVAVLMLLAAVAVWNLAIKESDEEKIEALVERVFVTETTACDLFTESFYEQEAQVSGEGVEEAKQDCLDNDAPFADSAAVANLRIEGGTATARVKFSDQGDKWSAGLTFVDEGGWKIDGFEYIEQF